MDLSCLNEEQKRAVTHLEGPMLVVAGAGTGKTRVITSRIAWLIKEQHARPEEILALTFTDKAAGEMLDRLDELIGWDAYRVSAMTFNAFGRQILQQYGHHLGFPTTGEVISGLGKVLLIKQQYPKLKLSYYNPGLDSAEFIKGFVDYIEALHNADISADQFESFVSEQKNNKTLHPLDLAELQDRAEVYSLYERIKRAHGLVDYYDQLKLPVRLLTERPNVVERLKARFKFVLVDEYQDTNAVQDALLRHLVPPGGNVFAVGDDDQAIYGFRGARLTNILNFAEHFGVEQPIVLTHNYRSGQAILDAAYKMIRRNDPERLESRLGISKRLKAQFDCSPPAFKPYAAAREEYAALAEALAGRLKNGEPADGIGVLATSHRVLKDAARALSDARVPYSLTSTVDIFDQPEVRQLWHLLRWIGLEASDNDILHLLPGTFIGWDSEQVRRLSERCRKDLCSAEDALVSAAISDESAASLVRQLSGWRQWAKDLTVGHLAYRLVFESGLADGWIEASRTDGRMVRVFEDLVLWFNQMHDFENYNQDGSLNAYLETWPLEPVIETEETVGEGDGVSLMTVHAAKGLEFDAVYLIGCTQEAWSERSGGAVGIPEELASADDLPPEHEKRRLMYVAMTRAKKELLLSAPVLQTDGKARRANPLLAEIFPSAELQLKSEPRSADRLEEALSGLQRFAPKTMLIAPGKLPLLSADGWLELTTSDIENYDKCPFEFYIDRVLKIKTPMGPQVNFGSLLHNLIHEYYETKMSGEAIAMPELEQKLRERFSDRGYTTRAEAEQALELALTTLRSFWAREEREQRVIVSTEEEISLEIPEAKLRVRGRIDATFRLEEGLEIRDFKTGRLRDIEKLNKKAKESPQLRTYALAVAERTGSLPARVVLDYIVTGTEGVANLSPLIMKNHRDKLIRIAQRIRDLDFEPASAFGHSCSAYRYFGDIGDGA